MSTINHVCSPSLCLFLSRWSTCLTMQKNNSCAHHPLPASAEQACGSDWRREDPPCMNGQELRLNTM